MKIQSERINRQIYENRLLLALKKVLKTQRAAAIAIGCAEDMYFYYMNHAKKIPLEMLLKAKAILHQHREKIPELSDEILCIEDELLIFLPFSLQASLALEDLSKAKQARKESLVKNTLKKDKKRENFPKNGRLDEVIAKKYSFKNRKTFHQAIYVIKNGCTEVIQAMDKQKIKIYLAAKLSTLPETLQQELVIQNNKIIIAYFKEKKVKSKQFNITQALQAIKTHPIIIEAEKLMQLSITNIIQDILYNAYH
jgi:hypothetical protein